MKKVRLIGILSIIAFTTALNGFATGLVPRPSTFGDRPVCHPIFNIDFLFDGAIAVAENTTATVYADGIPVVTGVLSGSNFVWERGTQGTASVSFDPPLLLPKGNTYRLVVPEGVIYREGNPDISNEELTAEFNVPEDLGDARPSIEEGSSVEYAGRIGFYFSIETAPLENGKAILLREGIPVREYPCDVSWDWYLGYAGINFGETVYFEKGVRYSIKIPEGNVSALYRPDIVNKEVEVNFIGCYTEPVKPLRYIWCSLYDHHLDGVVGEVKFYYDQPVELSVNPRVQLCLEGENTVVKEVVPTLAQEDGQYVLTADFEETPLADGKGYTIVIPEGTLVTEAGVFVNSRNETEVITSGISDVAASGAEIRTEGGAIAIDNVPDGSEVILYSPGGSVLHKTVAAGGSVSIPAGTGIYLLTIDGKAYKISVKQ